MNNVSYKPILLIGVAAGVLLSTIAGSTSASSEVPPVAQKQVEQWLSLLDAQNYEASWERAGTFFKQQVTVSQWQSAAQKVHKSFGAVQSRSAQTATATTDVPGAPDGNYVIFMFNTTFEHKQNAVETVTAVEEMGAWRVVGYFVR